MVMDKLKEYSAKSGIPLEEIIKKYENIVSIEKKKGKTENEASHIAMIRLRTQIRADLKDQSEYFEGIVLSPGSKNAYLKAMYTIAMKAYEKDSNEAIEEGLVNEEGKPLDKRETFGSGKVNPDYGKILTEIDYGDWKGQKLTYEDKGAQDVIGLACKINDDEVKMFVMQLFDGNGKIPIEVGKPIKFKAFVKANEKEKYTLGVSNKTTLDDVIDKEPFNVAEIIESGSLGELIPIEEMPEWFENNANNYDAFFITQGVVENLALNGAQNNIITLSDMNLDLNDDLENEIVYKSWLPKSSRIDFAEGSIVYIFGGRRHWLTEDNVLNMQESGIYAPPEYKVNLNEIDELNNMIDEEFEDEEFEDDGMI